MNGKQHPNTLASVGRDPASGAGRDPVGYREPTPTSPPPLETGGAAPGRGNSTAVPGEGHEHSIPGVPGEIEQLVDRISLRHSAGMRALRDELSGHPEPVREGSPPDQARMPPPAVQSDGVALARAEGRPAVAPSPPPSVPADTRSGPPWVAVRPAAPRGLGGRRPVPLLLALLVGTLLLLLGIAIVVAELRRQGGAALTAQGAEPSSDPTVAAAPTASLPTATTGVPGGGTPPPGLVDVVLQRCVAAEMGFRTGQLEATIDYGGGDRATVQLRFDLGDSQSTPQFHIVSHFRGGTGSQTIEHVAIGAQTWRKPPDGHWEAAPTQEGIWERVRFYLPNAHTIVGATASGNGTQTTLDYHDTTLGADAQLTVDSATGRPLQLRREVRATGVVTTVAYREWNTRVVIDPPDAR